MEPSFVAKWLDSVKQNVKDCVVGYIKEAQQLLPVDIAYYNIPDLVLYLVLYYYYNREYFTICSGKMSLNDDCDTVTLHCTDSNTCTVYGNILIICNESWIYQWRVKILKTTTDTYNTGIGIDSSNKLHVNSCYVDENSKGFIFWEKGKIETLNGEEMDHERFDQDDVVTITLNTKMKSCELAVNDNNGKEIGRLIDWTKTYYFALTLDSGIRSELVSSQLIEFKQSLCVE